MRLLRVQVPEFRVLQNVDITFEKDFFPSIFPLGSQNGGGKSTLLQLIFGLLHCSGNSERKEFLRNLLYGFNLSNDNTKRVLASIEIWYQGKNINIEFFVWRDSHLLDVMSNIDSKINSHDELKFSIYQKINTLNNKIEQTEKTIRLIEKTNHRLGVFSKIENAEERSIRIISEITNLQKYGLLQESRWKNAAVYPIRTPSLLEEVKAEIEQVLAVSKINLKLYYEECERVEITLQEIKKYLKQENLIYVCNYSAKGNREEDEVLLCRIDNIDITVAETFLNELSQKIFLTAPATQVFLFLYPKYRKLLFRVFGEQPNENDYYSRLKAAKSVLPGLFTYDFLAVDVFIQSFKAARDRDFREAIETGEYGNSYKTLIKDLNLLLTNKKINIDKDLSGVTFKLDKDGETVELYPEDLSHGELKRLSIYMWLKYYNIEDAIVLMDEIEIAFHPDWQYQIISDLKEWAPSNQYILATHSYELCQALTPAHVKELEPKLLKQQASS